MDPRWPCVRPLRVSGVYWQYPARGRRVRSFLSQYREETGMLRISRDGFDRLAAQPGERIEAREIQPH